MEVANIIIKEDIKKGAHNKAPIRKIIISYILLNIKEEKG